MERYNLSDTIDDMLSDDWKLRLRAEYLQAKYRYEKLTTYLEKNVINDVKVCMQLRKQADILELYMLTLLERVIEAKIDLTDYHYVNTEE